VQLKFINAKLAIVKQAIKARLLAVAITDSNESRYSRRLP